MTFVQKDNKERKNMEITSEDIVKIMKAMEVNMEKLTKEIKVEIKNSNETLGEKIEESREEMRTEMKKMNGKIETVIEDTENLKKENEKVRREVKKVGDENEKRMKRMEGRMEEYEQNKRDLERQEMKRKELEKLTLVEKDGGKKKTYSDVTGQPEGRTNKDNQPTVEVVEFKSSWARQMSQANLEKQLRLASEAAARVEKEGGEYEKVHKTKKKINKLGNSMECHEEADWQWDSNDTEWDGTTDRVAKNKEKREKEIEKKRKKVEKAAYIGKCTIGVGPILKELINYFHKITGDYSLAKKMAAGEFLQGYLKFDENDMNDMDITDTKISGKGDNIMYIVLDCPEKVINIRKRVADCRNENIKMQDYIPPQFFLRYSALSKYSHELRSSNPDIKMQIRFSDDNIVLYTKLKGTQEPFLPENMPELIERIKLPAIDPNADWKRREELPPWRRTSPVTEKVCLKSLGGRSVTGSGGVDAVASLKRNSSKCSSELQNITKKTKNQVLSADSSPDKSLHESPAKRNSMNDSPMNTSA